VGVAGFVAGQRVRFDGNRAEMAADSKRHAACCRARAMGRTIIAILPLVLASCTAQTSEGPDSLPGLGGKADITDQVNLRGTIEFGGSVGGEFVDDLQYDAWAFGAREGAVIEVEVTHAGSSSRLDDLLFVYGPSDDHGSYANATRLAFDEDDGWGPHARIDELALPAEGNYLVIVGTEGGDGRGAYNLALTCRSGACGRDVPDLATCDGSILGRADLCMEAKVYDDGESLEDAFEWCAGEDSLAEQFIDQCEYSSTPPTYCGAGLDRFREEMIPACRATIGFEHGLTLGPTNPSGSAEFAAWAADQSLESLGSLPPLDLARTAGAREVRDSALGSSLEDALYPSLDGRGLADLNPAWSDILLYDSDDFTEARELEWALTSAWEIWADGEVIGYVGQSDTAVCYWHPSDPDDPTCDDFTAFVLVGVDAASVRELYDGP
jgi:hypothetical protein